MHVNFISHVVFSVHACGDKLVFLRVTTEYGYLDDLVMSNISDTYVGVIIFLSRLF